MEFTEQNNWGYALDLDAIVDRAKALKLAVPHRPYFDTLVSHLAVRYKGADDVVLDLLERGAARGELELMAERLNEQTRVGPTAEDFVGFIEGREPVGLNARFRCTWPRFFAQQYAALGVPADEWYFRVRKACNRVLLYDD